MDGLRLVFMGTPAFAVTVLDALVAAGHRIECVYTRAPRPAGRGRRERRSPVHEAALARGIPVRTPATLKPAEEHRAFAALEADAAVVAAYGLLLPPAILDAPRLGCLNVHASLLPRWRGAAPIQRAILAGDRETGVTIMRMDAGLDTGDIVLSARVPIGPKTTAGELHDTLAALGGRLVVRALEGLHTGRLVPRPQPASGVTTAPRLTPAEERLDWRRPAAVLERQVRALAPRPGAWFDARGERIRILAAETAAGDGAPGTILDDRFTVACGEGALRPLRLQRAGRRETDAAAFLRGFSLPPGTVLSVPEEAAP